MAFLARCLPCLRWTTAGDNRGTTLGPGHDDVPYDIAERLKQTSWAADVATAGAEATADSTANNANNANSVEAWSAPAASCYVPRPVDGRHARPSSGHTPGPPVDATLQQEVAAAEESQSKDLEHFEHCNGTANRFTPYSMPMCPARPGSSYHTAANLLRSFSMEGALFESADGIPAGPDVAQPSSQNSSSLTEVLRPVTAAAANGNECNVLKEHPAGNQESHSLLQQHGLGEAAASCTSAAAAMGAPAAILAAPASPAVSVAVAAVMGNHTGIQPERTTRTAGAVTAAARAPVGANSNSGDVGARSNDVDGGRAVLNTADLTVDVERSAVLLQLQPTAATAATGSGTGSGGNRAVGAGAGTRLTAVQARAELARPLAPSAQAQLQPPASPPLMPQQQSHRCQRQPSRLAAATAAVAMVGDAEPSSAAATPLQRGKAAPESEAAAGTDTPAAATNGSGASGAASGAMPTAVNQMGSPHQYYLGSGACGALGTAGEAVGCLLNLAQVRGIVTDLRVLHIRPGAALLLGRAASTDVTVVARFERGLPEQLLSQQLLRVAAAAHAEGRAPPRHPNVATLEQVHVIALPAHVLDAGPHAPPAVSQQPPSWQPLASTPPAPASSANLPSALPIGGMSPLLALMGALASNSPAGEAPAGPVQMPTAISAAHFHAVAAAAQASNSGGAGATSSNAGHLVLSHSTSRPRSNIIIQRLGSSTGYCLPASATGATAVSACDALMATAASIALCADDTLLDPDALVATRAMQQAEVVRGAPAGATHSRSLARSRVGSLLSFASFAAAAVSHGNAGWDGGAASGAPLGASPSAMGGVLGGDATGVTSCSRNPSGEAAAATAAVAGGAVETAEESGGTRQQQQQQQGRTGHVTSSEAGDRLLDVLRGPTVRLPDVVGALRSGTINESSNAPVHTTAVSAAALLSLPVALPSPSRPLSTGAKSQSYPRQSQSRLHATFGRSSAVAATAVPAASAPTPRTSASAAQPQQDIGFATLTLTELCDGGTLQEEAKRGSYKCMVLGFLDAWPREAPGVRRGAATAGLWSGGERGSGDTRYKALLDPGKVFSDLRLVARLEKFLLTALDIARGLQHLHGVLGVPHGDLASRNVLLHRCTAAAAAAVDRPARHKPGQQHASAGAEAYSREAAAAVATPAEPFCLIDARGYLAKLVGYGRLTAAAAEAGNPYPPMLSGCLPPAQAPYINLQKSPSEAAVATDISAAMAGAAAADNSGAAGWLALPAAAGSSTGRGGSMRARTVSLAATLAASAAAAGAAAGALDTGVVSGGMSGSPGAGALAAYVGGSSAVGGFGGGGGGGGWSCSGRALPSGLQLPGASCSSVLGTAPAAAASGLQHCSGSYAVPPHSATSITRLQQVQVGLWRDVHCLAPERLTDPTSPPSAEADVYALGAIMYEMAYGEAPWAGMTTACVAVGAATGDMRITCTQPLALACITDLIERCTSPAPEQRPSLAEVVAALVAAAREAAAGREMVVAQRQEREARRLQAMLLGSSLSARNESDGSDDSDDIMGI